MLLKLIRGPLLSLVNLSPLHEKPAVEERNKTATACWRLSSRRGGRGGRGRTGDTHSGCLSTHSRSHVLFMSLGSNPPVLCWQTFSLFYGLFRPAIRPGIRRSGSDRNPSSVPQRLQSQRRRCDEVGKQRVALFEYSRWRPEGELYIRETVRKHSEVWTRYYC